MSAPEVPRIWNGERSELSDGSSVESLVNMPNKKPHVALTATASFVDEISELLAARSDYELARARIIVGAYVDWAERIRGLPLAERLIFDPEVISIYIRDGIAAKRISKSSVASYRSALLRVCEILLPRDWASTAPVGQRQQLKPYAANELDYFEKWMCGQREELMNRKAVAFICLGLGCGLRAGEINRLRAGDVRNQNGVVVTITNGESTRDVPMVRRWEPPFRHLLEGLRPHDYIFGRPKRAVSPNAISEFVVGSRGTIKPNSYRMRSTWIVGRLAMGAHLPTLLQAAGLEGIDKLNEYISYLSAPTDATFEHLHEGVDR